jgi:hypothetical protein
MTAVQWWCSGVVLHNIFGQSSQGPRPPQGDATANSVSSGQGQPGQSAAATASRPSGATFDRTA